MNKAYEISIIRIFSAILIVICHIQSHYGYGICEWFNVGVQVFFFMSGYLLGTNSNRNSEWLFKRIKRIFVDYWIFVLFIIILYYFITPENLSTRTIIHLLCGKDMMKVKGFGHLWFVRPMFLCYLQVFLMEYLVNKLQNCKIANKIIGGVLS